MTAIFVSLFGHQAYTLRLLYLFSSLFILFRFFPVYIRKLYSKKAEQKRKCTAIKKEKEKKGNVQIQHTKYNHLNPKLKPGYRYQNPLHSVYGHPINQK